MREKITSEEGKIHAIPAYGPDITVREFRKKNQYRNSLVRN
ncbi:hypothetical protein [Methanoplanus limicola]|nr:hypothetical protein [Methanoplanus limicola]